ncbi:hypothetical protein FB451DRAFT_1059200, partial [Mycena latifolia]
ITEHVPSRRVRLLPRLAATKPATDYPRPAAPPAGEEVAHVPPPLHDDEPLRKDKKHQHDSERKLMELSQRKAEMTRPTRDLKNTGKGFGGAGRIAQPTKDLRV